MNFLAILTLRNEGAYLLEWLAHHRAVGFTQFLVFSNDCDDGSDIMLDHLHARGVLTHVRNDGPHDARGIQFSALKIARKMDIVTSADWIMALDIDEFVNIHVGARRLPDLVSALPEATAITLTWRLFGNAAHKRYTDTLMTQKFTACAPEVMPWTWRAFMFKTLYRNDGVYGAPGVHRPKAPDANRLNEARWFDAQGRALGDDFKTKRIFSDYTRPNYALAQLNHYPLGTMESYILKSDRGRAVHGDDVLGMDYWVERNLNTDQDTSIHAFSAPLNDALTTLKSDPVLADLHAKAVVWRHARFDALMREDRFRALYARLLMTPPSHPIQAQDAKIMLNFARTPSQNGDN